LRNRAISSLTTPAAIRERQRWVTETFWDLVGGMPERTPLNARTVGTFERQRYRVEKVVYESQPNFHISGTLYIPTVGEPPFPGVLYQMGNTENVACANFNPPGSTDDAEQDLVASTPVGFDRWDLLYPIAPKPLLVMVSQRDFFGTYSPNYLTSGNEEFQKLQDVYRRLGHPDRIAWSGTPLPHGFSFDLRMQMYNWFARWLKGESQPVAEEPVIQPELYNRMAAEGCVVCAPDLRGIGDMTPEFGRGAARHARPHNSEEDYAWSALILGKPLAGQRVTDILSIVRCLPVRPEFARRRVILASREVLTVPAQFAAALEPAISSLYLAEGLISFRSIVETEVYKYPFGNFVPNLLAHTDLPELTTSLAPRQVTLAGTVDGAGNRMKPDAVRAEFPSASNIRVLPEPAWSPSDILYVFCERARRPNPPGKPFDWDRDGPRVTGSVAGLFLMGSGNAVRWDDNLRLRQRMNAIVTGISACRQPNGFIMGYEEKETGRNLTATRSRRSRPIWTCTTSRETSSTFGRS
jgi:hypothetical protein